MINQFSLTHRICAFTKAYIECALWSTNTVTGRSFEEDFGPEDIAPETLEQITTDCKRFQEENATDISAGPYDPDYLVWERAGHDFWLTRNGHGAGFWDGDWPEEIGERLTEASKAYGEVDLYVGDDGMIYS